MIGYPDVSKAKRLRELDFLRGLAILLVLVRHRHITDFTSEMGWIGVDLFFVLSGFLVSGLLFKEYQKFGSVKPVHFLIRRGFKIYPIYFIFYIPYLIPKIVNGEFMLFPFLGDMFFIQNYVSGWGYGYGASWSLAIEEHFYFGLAILLWMGFSKGFIVQNKNTMLSVKGLSIDKLILFIMMACVLFRLASNYLFPNAYDRNFTMTHLRIDSLLAGVLISFFFHFNREVLQNIYNKYKYALLVIAIGCLSWTPFFVAITSVFVKTIGFSLLYIAFGIILLYFIISKRINQDLNKIFSRPVTNAISYIGFCSYSIYVIHQFINWSFDAVAEKMDLHMSLLPGFIIPVLLSILAGMLMTYKVEHYFLSIRSRYFPSRA